MNVKDIIREWLTTHGYGGLLNIDDECGCELPDLAPCDNLSLDYCEPGFKAMCNEDCKHAHGDRPQAGRDWHIQREKP